MGESLFLMHCQTRRATYAASFLALGIALGAANVVVQGPLTGDVAVTKLVQTVCGTEPPWAEFVTKTAKHPWVWPTLVVGCGLAWLRAGRLGPFSVIAVFLAVKFVDVALRAVIHTPKPIAELVAVASPSESSGFPSTFGLVYGAIFGAVLFAPAKSNWQSTVSMMVAAAMIVVGAGSRIVLGGHWASQMLASMSISFSLVLMLNYFVEPKRVKSATMAASEPV